MEKGGAVRDSLNAALFLWATLGTGLYDVCALAWGGYDASITATVRAWYGPLPWLRAVVAVGFLWLAFHFGIEDLLCD